MEIKGLARKASISGPTHTTRSAARRRWISEGRSAKSCGDAPSGNSTSVGVTPSAIAAAIKPTGRIEVTTAADALLSGPAIINALASNVRCSHLFFCAIISNPVVFISEA
ncbi:hypothetical protein D3C78_1560490 [compost metagenome]